MGPPILELLGMFGRWAKNNSEPSDHHTTKIGGLPDWPIPQLLSSKPHLLRCANCRVHLCLVAQVYAPIREKSLRIEERVIYVLGCLNPKCQRNQCSWRAIRVQRLKPANKEVVQKNSFVDGCKIDTWTEEGNDDEDIDLEELGRALSEAASLAASLSKKRVTKRTVKSSPLSPEIRVVFNNTPVLPCFYTYTKKEFSSRELLKQQQTQEAKTWKGMTRKAKCEEDVYYEYTGTRNSDRTYFRFTKCLEAHPSQCFRYSYGGKPLLAMVEVEYPGRCRHCGGSMHYEMQLTPALLYFLQKRADNRVHYFLNHWEWLTVIVFTCSKSCSPPSDQEKSDIEGWEVAEEVVFIQYEKRRDDISCRNIRNF